MRVLPPAIVPAAIDDRLQQTESSPSAPLPPDASSWRSSAGFAPFQTSVRHAPDQDQTEHAHGDRSHTREYVATIRRGRRRRLLFAERAIAFDPADGEAVDRAARRSAAARTSDALLRSKITAW